jgi:uncharacterized protein (TIGR03118 family)
MHKLATVFSLVGAATFGLTACGGSSDNNMPASTPASMPASTPSTTTTTSTFKSTILVSDGSVAAAHVDPNLQNAWGIAFGATSPVWVSANNTQKSTLYDGNGVVQSLVVTLPPATNAQPGSPTGIVANATTDFTVTAPSKPAAPSLFIFATLAGTIAGWSPSALATQAITVVDNSASATEYTGLAMASNAGANTLYAADFHNGKVDMFDKNFAPITASGTFVDPNLPAGFNPFGIQAVGTTIYVAYAKLGPDGHRDQSGAGNGVVDAFDTAGHLIKRITANGLLNSPWGMAMAPANFGTFSNDLLVGNFGDGTINAFDPNTGALVGTLTQADGSKLTQTGLWGLAFGNNADSQPSNTLFFAAGPTATTGVYGRIDASM